MLRALLKKILRPSQLRLITCSRTLAAFLPAKLFLLFYLFTFKSPFLLFYFFNVRHQDVLINLPIILTCDESESHDNQIPRIEFALSSIAQDVSSILVLVLAAQLFQHDSALPHLTILHLLTLYCEWFTLLNNSQKFCFHNKKKQDLAFL